MNKITKLEQEMLEKAAARDAPDYSVERAYQLIDEIKAYNEVGEQEDATDAAGSSDPEDATDASIKSEPIVASPQEIVQKIQSGEYVAVPAESTKRVRVAGVEYIIFPLSTVPKRLVL